MYTRALDRLFRVRSLVGSIRKAFSPRDLFSTGANGVWYDPSDYGTLFQDAAGTTPVTAVEQPVGLMLDKSKGLVLGPELVSNYSFDSNINGWTPQPSVTVSRDTSIFPSGALKIQVTSASGATYVEQSLGSNFIVGRKYKATATVYTSSSTPSTVGAAISFVNATFTGATSVAQSQKDIAQTLTIYFTATSTTHSIYLAICTLDFMSWGSVGSVAYFDNISVRELPGNHAFQSTSANRPTLSARYNLLTKTETFSDAVWAAGHVNLAGPPTKGTLVGVRPDGTSGVIDTLTFPAVTAVQASFTYQSSGAQYLNTGLTGSIYAKVASGTATVYLYMEDTALGPSGGNFVASNAIQVTSEWTKISLAGIRTAASGNLLFGIGFDSRANASHVNSSPLTIQVWGADLRPSNDALNQPAYQRVNTATDYDTVGFKPYLSFNGTSSSMQTNSIDFTYGYKMFVSAGVRKLSDGARAIVLELSNSTVNNGSFAVDAPGTDAGTVRSYLFTSVGTSIAAAMLNLPASAAPITNVLSGIGNISAPSATLRVNGAQVAQSTATQGTGNYGNYPLYIGARAGSSLWFNGRLYGLIIVGKAVRSVEITSTEAWLNNKTRAY